MNANNNIANNNIEYHTLPNGKVEQILRPDNMVIYVGTKVKVEKQQQGGTTNG